MSSILELYKVRYNQRFQSGEMQKAVGYGQTLFKLQF